MILEIALTCASAFIKILYHEHQGASHYSGASLTNLILTTWKHTAIRRIDRKRNISIPWYWYHWIVIFSRLAHTSTTWNMPFLPFSLRSKPLPPQKRTIPPLKHKKRLKSQVLTVKSKKYLHALNCPLLIPQRVPTNSASRTQLAPKIQHTLRGNATARAARACPSPLKN